MGRHISATDLEQRRHRALLSEYEREAVLQAEPKVRSWGAPKVHTSYARRLGDGCRRRSRRDGC
jgi:hypothetical protein